MNSASTSDDVIDRRAREHVATELETAADKAFLEAHKAGQRARETTDESTAAMFRAQSAEHQRRGHYYARAAAHVRGQRTGSPMDAAMGGLAAVIESDDASAPTPVRSTRPRPQRAKRGAA